MKSCLIGYSGFVGSNLRKQNRFSDEYNSSNIDNIAKNSYDLAVCAGISAKKWIANKNPDEDIKNIKSLADALRDIDIKHFVLISTIDVYPKPIEVDEDTDPSLESNHAYGENRLWFEAFVKDSFRNYTIIRLPGLFGEGLKKNIIYDLMNDNCLDMINPKSSFQYYPLKNLWNDIEKVISQEIRLINFATEPINTQSIIDKFFEEKSVGSNKSQQANYDFKTKYSTLWKGPSGYLYDRDFVLDALKNYLEGALK